MAQNRDTSEVEYQADELLREMALVLEWLWDDEAEPDDLCAVAANVLERSEWLLAEAKQLARTEAPTAAPVEHAEQGGGQQ